MQRTHVNSSNITSIGWGHGTLEVEFHHGGVYQYSGVPESVYRAFLSAYSKGSYFHDHIKDRYPYREVA
jgi:hypothetical protein